MHLVDSFPGRIAIANQKSYLYFGGTAYLGLQDHTPFQDIFIKNIKRYGTNYGASRKSNIQFSVFKKAESQLAAIVGSEACLTVSSGYLAGQFLSQYLLKLGYQAFYAPNTHSALHGAHAQNSASYATLEVEIQDYLKSDNPAPAVLFLDSIDFSGCNYPNFEALQQLPLSQLTLVVDDSHGIGVVGTNGSGVYTQLQSFGAREILMSCSLGKGYGIQAGAVFGSTKVIDQLENSLFFGGASPASPAAMATFIEAQAIYKNRQDTLSNNLKTFLEASKLSHRMNHMPGHPTFSYQDDALTEELYQNGILVTNFKYPNEDASVMSRIVLSASHTKNDILAICKIIDCTYKNQKSRPL